LSWSERDILVNWHPFTQMKLENNPLPIVKAEGAYLYDDKGERYIDAISSWWVNIHGHCHPHIAEAIAKQAKELDQVIFAGFTHPKAVELSERLLTLLGKPYQKVFFSDDGSTAVEVAIKMAMQYWFNQGYSKPEIIAFKQAYHGDTFGAMSIGGRGGFNKPYEPLLFDVKFIDAPAFGNEKETISALRNAISDRTSAFIFEPLVLGSNGMFMYSEAVLNELIKICKQNNVITIVDEVMTGFGRTGKMFATQDLVNRPDIMVLSKGITGGSLPLSVTVTNDNIYHAFYDDDKRKMFFHGHSYTANAISCAAACASLDVFENENTLDKIQQISDWHKQFRKELERLDNIKNIRQTGTIIAFDVIETKENSYFSSLRDILYKMFMDKKLLIRPLGNTVYLMPPYCISEKDMNEVYYGLLDVLKSI